MNRKITALAFAGKCGFFGAIGLGRLSFASARPWLNRLPSATEPTPRAQSWKKWRRVRYKRGLRSTVMLPDRFFPRDEFIEVEQHPAQLHPGGRLGDADAGQAGLLNQPLRGDPVVLQRLALPGQP